VNSKCLPWPSPDGEAKAVTSGRTFIRLAPIVVESIYETIKEIHRQGIPVLLVEQNAFLALMTAKRAYVIDTGRVVISGDAKDLLEDEQVRRAYLGG